MNPLLDFKIEQHAAIVRLSTYAANAGGLDTCINKCHYLNDKEEKIIPHANKPGGKLRDYREMRCCAACSPGYMLSIEKEKRKEIEKQPELMPDPDFGFWKKGVGCKLPRDLRPHMCLLYSCGTMDRHAPSATTALRQGHLISWQTKTW